MAAIQHHHRTSARKERGVKLIVQKLGAGYTVHEMYGRGDEWPALCAATTLSEALAFIRSRMEPEGEGKPNKTVELGPKMDPTLYHPDMFKFRASEPDTREPRRFMDDKPKANVEIVNIVGKTTCTSKPLDKLQRLGQEFEKVWDDNAEALYEPSAAAEPAWKRAKVEAGKSYRTRAGDVVGPMEKFDYQEGYFIAVRGDGRKWSANGRAWEVGAPKPDLDAVEEAPILPTPPRHGDFGSMNQEDGA
jgi:hypothetical protein